MPPKTLTGNINNSTKLFLKICPNNRGLKQIYEIENDGPLYDIWNLWEENPDKYQKQYLDSLQKYDTPLIIAHYEKNVRHGKYIFYEKWKNGGRRETIYNYGKKIKFTIWNMDSVKVKEEFYWSRFRKVL